MPARKNVAYAACTLEIFPALETDGQLTSGESLARAFLLRLVAEKGPDLAAEYLRQLAEDPEALAQFDLNPIRLQSE